MRAVARGAGVALAATALAVTVAACGGDDDGSSGSQATAAGASTASESTERQSITMAVAAPSPVLAAAYVAAERGYYEDAGVDVTLIDNSGSNTLNYVASGRADLASTGPGGALALAQQGQDISIVYSSMGGGSGGMLVANPKIGSIEDLKGKRIGALGKGTSMYGYASIYNSRYDLGATIVPFTTVGAVISALASGQVDAASVPFPEVQGLVADGDAKILIDTRDREKRVDVNGQDYPESVIFGLTKTVDEKRDGVTAVLKALDQANEYMQSASAEEVAATLRKDDAWQTFKPEQLAIGVETANSYIGTGDGRIDKDTWDYALTQYAQWGAGVDPKSSAVGYDDVVDMSFLEAARQ